jgi:hypothetical protein
MSGKSGLKRLPRNWCQSLLLVLTVTGFGDFRICGVTKDREIKGWPRPGMYQGRNFGAQFRTGANFGTRVFLTHIVGKAGGPYR